MTLIGKGVSEALPIVCLGRLLSDHLHFSDLSHLTRSSMLYLISLHSPSIGLGVRAPGQCFSGILLLLFHIISHFAFSVVHNFLGGTCLVYFLS